jgi:hypothetical protein
MKILDLIQCLQEMDSDMEVMASDNHVLGRPGSPVVDGQFEGHSFYAVQGAEEAEGFCTVWLGPAPEEDVPPVPGPAPGTRTVEHMAEAEVRSLLGTILECVRAGRQAESSEDIGDMVSDEMAKAGLDVDAPCEYMSEEES